MKPELFTIPFVNMPIHGYGLMVVVGFLLSVVLARREARRDGLPEFVDGLGFTMLLSGIAGARLFHFIENYETEFADRSPLLIFAVWQGGLVFYGGALVGFAAALLHLRLRRLPISACLHSVFPFVPIAMGFGRIGCLFNGCCFGRPCKPSFLLGIIYPRSPDGGQWSAPFEHQVSQGLLLPFEESSLPVLPTQLYEAGLDLLLAVVLWWLKRAGLPRRFGFPSLFAAYGTGRFLLEFLRADNLPTATGLTTSQNVAIVTLAAAGVVLILFQLQSLRQACLDPRRTGKKP